MPLQYLGRYKSCAHLGLLSLVLKVPDNQMLSRRLDIEDIDDNCAARIIGV